MHFHTLMTSFAVLSRPKKPIKFSKIENIVDCTLLITRLCGIQKWTGRARVTAVYGMNTHILINQWQRSSCNDV